MHGKHSEKEIWGRSFGWCAGWNKWKMEQTQREQFRLQLNPVWGSSEPQGDGNKKNKDDQVTQCSHFVFGSGENNNTSSWHVCAAVHPGLILTVFTIAVYGRYFYSLHFTHGGTERFRKFPRITQEWVGQNSNPDTESPYLSSPHYPVLREKAKASPSLELLPEGQQLSVSEWLLTHKEHQLRVKCFL